VGVQSMPTSVDPKAIGRARKLRRNMTDGERKLWSELKEFRRLYGLHARKQAPIGPYVVDFVLHSKALVIEVDGEHHSLPDQIARDRHRDEWLQTKGYRVLRFTTGELADSFDGCIEEILRDLGLMEAAS
jgi:very-short-patch-repair endonuclease